MCELTTTGIQTTADRTDDTQTLRKTALIDRELLRLNISICALQETRLPDGGSLREQNYTFFWKGKDKSEPRLYGVGFAVRNDLLALSESPIGVSERVMVLRIKSSSGYVTLISAYAPTLSATAETKDAFFDELSATIRGTRTGDRLLSWATLMLALAVMQMRGPIAWGKFCRKVSWRHPRSGHWHQIDLILTKKKNLAEILHTRAFHSADCDTDHSLVVSRVAIIQKKIHSRNTLGRQSIDCRNIQNDKKLEEYSQLIKEAEGVVLASSLNEKWSTVKDLLTNGAEKVFGRRRVKIQDWFTDYEEELKPLVEAKREAFLCHRMKPSRITQAKLKNAQANLQRSSRYFSNKFWCELCRSIQHYAEASDFHGVFSAIKKALGPLPKKTGTLKELDGSLITNSDRQLSRWVEHYTALYSQPAVIDQDVLNHLPKLEVFSALDDPPSSKELDIAIAQLKCKKKPGCDGILPEIVKLRCLAPVLHNLLLECWDQGEVPQDMRDANIITLYKGKGDRGDCNSYRGISLLSVVGKLFGRVIVNRLLKLADRVYPEAQCGFRSQRSTIDMIFTLRQLQEKCREQQTPLFIAFVDLNKAFDSVSREGLYSGLEHIGCPPKLLSMIKTFHEETRGVIVYDGKTSEPFLARRGVRQGCVMAPTLFGIFFSLLLNTAFKNDQQGIHLHTRADGKLFNVSLLRSKRHRLDLFVDQLLFADDAAFVANSVMELQSILDKFSRACTLFSMSINTKKTVVLVQGPTDRPTFLLDGTPLQLVDKFGYLGSTVTSNLSMNAEIDSRIGKAAAMFGKLRDRVWENNHLTTKTKMMFIDLLCLAFSYTGLRPGLRTLNKNIG
ncbi:unnamed protein product [Colias eurytheme]|nr:unnamed protein product [Colias eurytheme]